MVTDIPDTRECCYGNSGTGSWECCYGNSNTGY